MATWNNFLSGSGVNYYEMYTSEHPKPIADIVNSGLPVNVLLSFTFNLAQIIAFITVIFCLWSAFYAVLIVLRNWFIPFIKSLMNLSLRGTRVRKEKEFIISSIYQ